MELILGRTVVLHRTNAWKGLIIPAKGQRALTYPGSVRGISPPFGGLFPT